MSLGKKTNDLARAQALRGHAHRIPGAAGRDRDAAGETQERMEDWFSIIALVDDESDRTRRSELENDRIHETDVIREKEKTTGRESFAARRGDTINQARRRRTKEIEGAFGEGGMRHCL